MATRRTQPYRASMPREPGPALTNMRRGATLYGTNPADVGRGAARAARGRAQRAVRPATSDHQGMAIMQQAPRDRRTQPWDDDLADLQELAFDGETPPQPQDLDPDDPVIQGFIALIDEFPELEDQELAGLLATAAGELAEDLEAPELVTSPLFLKLVWLAAGRPATSGDGGEGERGRRAPDGQSTRRRPAQRQTAERQPTADDIVNRRPGRRALPFAS